MMRKFKLPLYLHACLYAVVMFIVLWCVWYYCYYHSLVWFEGYSYFSTLSDVVFLSSVFPDDILKYAGAFLLQFYYYPAVGAALQALFAVVVMLCAMTVVVRLFDNPSRFLWLAAVPVPFFMDGQFWDYNLTRSLTWIVVSVVIAAVVFVFTIRKRRMLRLPSFVANIVVEIVATLIIIGFSVYNLGYKDNGCRMYQYVWNMEYLAETRQWDALLAIATPEEAQMNEIARRYALLALLEKGMLADNMFLYSVTAPDDFWFTGREEPMCRNYNALLFRSLGMPNEVIHNTFQQQIQSDFGISFAVLRRLVETNLETKNYVLAKKYMDILSHSTLMKWWVERKKPQLEAIRNVKPVFEAKGNQFSTNDLLMVASKMYNRYPDNRKYADIFLCGLLAEKDIDDFYPSFKVIATTQYANGERIPRYYQEALMLVASKKPEVLRKYSISRDVQEDFHKVMMLVNEEDVARVRSLYPDTFWAYYF